MEWSFGDYVLSRDRAELLGPDGPIRIERQPLELLFLLAQNTDRVVTKDEIISVVWEGRIVSDATISTAVKQARKAVGDNGTEQSVVRTVHGRGFRFVASMHGSAQPASVREPEPPQEPSGAAQPPIGTAQASIAALRFRFLGSGRPGPEIAEAIPAELISALSRLRWLHVIARGSSFRFDPDAVVPEEIAQQLHVRYLLCGAVEAIGDTLTITVEILSAADGVLIWSNRYATTLSEIQHARHRIVSSVIAALELHVPRFEAEHARSLTPAQFDAWSHFHIGLRHMYRFNVIDNRVAAGHFRAALELDAEFARAHAGLSFTQWQGAFMQFGEDRKLLLHDATAAAQHALEIDPNEPFASFCMGRALWLEGDFEAGLGWLERALTINPNFAQCHYTRGLSMILGGATGEASAALDTAMALSPLDPLLYAMLSTKAISNIASENMDEACRLAVQAVHTPGAHFYISMIAAMALELNGDRDRAARYHDDALGKKPGANAGMFFQAFPFGNRELRSKLSGSLRRLGFSE